MSVISLSQKIIFFLMIMVLTVNSMLSLAYAQMLDSDPVLQSPITNKSVSSGTAPQAAPSKRVVLTGQATTIEKAIQQESNVDWYRWYLACRSYIASHGAFTCPVGTMIRFYKNGRMEALSNDLDCVASTLNKNFPFPSNTRLTMVLLPVRSGKNTPASANEVYSRIRE